MRMIGIGLMAFFVAWAVFFLSSQNIPQRGLRQISEIAFGPQMVFETKPQKASVVGQKDKVFFRSNSITPIILTGLPARQGAVFSMPIDARPTSGYLQIDITSQVLGDVKGALRISINNTKRGEILLYPGEAGRSLLIPLLPSELIKERLVVSFSTLGSHATQNCSSKDGIDVIVEIETTSGIYLNLDRAIETPRDQVLSQGRTVQINWDQALTKQRKTELLDLGAGLIRNKERVLFNTSQPSIGLSVQELKVLKATLPKMMENKIKLPSYVAKQGANFGLRRFYETTSWRIKYAPRQYIERKLPIALELNLELSGLRDDAFWTILITFNGSLVHSEALAVGMKSYRKQVSLNTQEQMANNLIEVTAYSSENHVGVCNEGPLLTAQMEADTALVGGDKRFDVQLQGLQNALSQYKQVGISGLDDITDHQASLLSRLIAAVVPETTKLVAMDKSPEIQFLKRSQFKTAVQAHSERHMRWIVTFDDAEDISVWDIADDLNPTLLEEMSPNAIFIELHKTGASG